MSVLGATFQQQQKSEKIGIHIVCIWSYSDL